MKKVRTGLLKSASLSCEEGDIADWLWVPRGNEEAVAYWMVEPGRELEIMYMLTQMMQAVIMSTAEEDLVYLHEMISLLDDATVTLDHKPMAWSAQEVVTLLEEKRRNIKSAKPDDPDIPF